MRREASKERGLAGQESCLPAPSRQSSLQADHQAHVEGLGRRQNLLSPGQWYTDGLKLVLAN